MLRFGRSDASDCEAQDVFDQSEIKFKLAADQQCQVFTAKHRKCNFHFFSFSLHNHIPSFPLSRREHSPTVIGAERACNRFFEHVTSGAGQSVPVAASDHRHSTSGVLEGGVGGGGRGRAIARTHAESEGVSGQLQLRILHSPVLVSVLRREALKNLHALVLHATTSRRTPHAHTPLRYKGAVCWSIGQLRVARCKSPARLAR